LFKNVDGYLNKNINTMIVHRHSKYGIYILKMTPVFFMYPNHHHESISVGWSLFVETFVTLDLCWKPNGSNLCNSRLTAKLQFFIICVKNQSITDLHLFQMEWMCCQWQKWAVLFCSSYPPLISLVDYSYPSACLDFNARFQRLASNGITGQIEWVSFVYICSGEMISPAIFVGQKVCSEQWNIRIFIVFIFLFASVRWRSLEDFPYP